MRYAWWVMLSVSLAGCTSTNISEYIKALAGDGATVCVNAVYAGASINGGRTNIQNGEVQCTPQGMVIKSNGVAIPATLTVTPPVIVTPK